jgi:hypothetical protein
MPPAVTGLQWQTGQGPSAIQFYSSSTTMVSVPQFPGGPLSSLLILWAELQGGPT